MLISILANNLINEYFLFNIFEGKGQIFNMRNDSEIEEKKE